MGGGGGVKFFAKKINLILNYKSADHVLTAMLIIILHTFVSLNNNDLRIVDNYNAMSWAHCVKIIITDAANPQTRYL